jgi:hypothetical protein
MPMGMGRYLTPCCKPDFHSHQATTPGQNLAGSPGKKILGYYILVP